MEVDHEGAEGGRPLGRVWLVRLRRGARGVVVASELGRPTADYLARQIAQLLSSPRKKGGGTTD